ncbi:hypothetical protein AWZ03_000299 [Drosophila navojoa]|uniref:Uncharacterized protein n=1 Tax=Drosophila navojoa TaxID=7232 RepID=A0A484BXV1_DRONA|nr:hypothetical protein AWZ03_000299 [Drosophila navojoa]
MALITYAIKAQAAPLAPHTNHNRHEGESRPAPGSDDVERARTLATALPSEQQQQQQQRQQELEKMLSQAAGQATAAARGLERGAGLLSQISEDLLSCLS